MRLKADLLRIAQFLTLYKINFQSEEKNGTIVLRDDKIYYYARVVKISYFTREKHKDDFFFNNPRVINYFHCAFVVSRDVYMYTN